MFCAAGRTITTGNPDLMEPAIKVQELVPRAARKVVLFVTSKITDQSIFTNGLFQNIYFLYLLAEVIGYTPFFLFNEKDLPSKRPDFMKSLRVITIEDIVKNPIPIHAYVEIGMSLNPELRTFLKTLGTKIIKLYLGNILNIDIETPMYYINQNFSHHVVGACDEVWVSPHYEMHREYAASLNHVPISPDKAKIAPYVWEPLFLTRFGTVMPRWVPPAANEPITFLIMEPNISFQKTAVIPLMMLEAFHRVNPSVKFNVKIVNGERLQHIPYSSQCFLPRLEIFRKGFVELLGRLDMRSALSKYPSAYPICHNYNNEYNYMIFEYLYSGFPVIHNAPTWRDAGYYFHEESIEEGVKVIAVAIERHTESVDTFIGQGKPILFRHSIYNPKVQTVWKELLG